MLNTEFAAAAEKTNRLMVVLHGLGDSSAGFHWLPEALNLPWLNYLLVNAPDSYYGGYSWYDFAGDMIPGVRRSRDLLFEVLDASRAKGFPTENTTVLGFSQGCLMTIEVGLSYPHHFAGLVGISGYVSQPDKLIKDITPVARKQRFLVTHGVQDPVVPFDVTHDQIQLLKSAGLDIAWHELQKAHTIAGESEIKLIRDFVTAGYQGDSK